MKTVKIHFVGFWPDLDFENNIFSVLLKRRYNVVFDSVDPDFLFCSPLGEPFDYMKYDCPRIMYTGEFLTANFNTIDYFIGYDDISFGDRAFRFPLFLFDKLGDTSSNRTITEDEAVKILKDKEYFCNYIFGHDTELGVREKILEGLSAYKRVECAGRHRNNMPGGKTFNMHNKMPFMQKCKFAIAAESVRYPGFTSEKIGHAFDAMSIPVYFGDPDVGKDFNEDAFVDYNRYKTVEAMVEKVIEIDQRDDLYIHMLCQNRYNQARYEEMMFDKLAAFLYHIFDQDKEEAYRRPRFYCAERHETYLRHYNDMLGTIPWKIDRKMRYLAWRWRKIKGSDEERGLLIQ